MLEWNKKAFQLSMGDFSEEYIRKVAIVSAVVGFFVHILVWVLFETGNITITGEASELVKSPLSTLYTPFSILLVYEVYQLIRTIPDSFSSSVGKQYEIATLLVVRDVLKRLSEVQNSQGWKISSDLGFLLVECVAFLVLLYTSLTYFKISSSSEKSEEMTDNIAIFVEAKRGIANAMLLIFLVIAAYSFYTWYGSVQEGGGSVSRVKTVIIPKENEKDLSEIPDNIKQGLEIKPVSYVDEALEIALANPLIPIVEDNTNSDKGSDKGLNIEPSTSKTEITAH